MPLVGRVLAASPSSFHFNTWHIAAPRCLASHSSGLIPWGFSLPFCPVQGSKWCSPFSLLPPFLSRLTLFGLQITPSRVDFRSWKEKTAYVTPQAGRAQGARQHPPAMAPGSRAHCSIPQLALPQDREQHGQSHLPVSYSRSSICGTPSSPPRCGVSSSCLPTQQPRRQDRESWLSSSAPAPHKERAAFLVPYQKYFSRKSMKCNMSPDPCATQTCCCPRELQGTLAYLWFSVLISLHALQRGDEAAHRVFPSLHICTGENTAGCICTPSLPLHLYMVALVPDPSH